MLSSLPCVSSVPISLAAAAATDSAVRRPSASLLLFYRLRKRSLSPVVLRFARLIIIVIVTRPLWFRPAQISNTSVVAAESYSSATVVRHLCTIIFMIPNNMTIIISPRRPSSAAVWRRHGRRRLQYYDGRPAKFYKRPCVLSPTPSTSYYYYYYCGEALFIFVVYPYPSRTRTEPIPDILGDCPATSELGIVNKPNCIFFIRRGHRWSDT